MTLDQLKTLLIENGIDYFVTNTDGPVVCMNMIFKEIGEVVEND